MIKHLRFWALLVCVLVICVSVIGCKSDDNINNDPQTESESTTEAPTTEEPTTEAPTTEEPTTEEPATEEPTTEEPTTEEPTTEEPTTEEPTTEEPTTEPVCVHTGGNATCTALAVCSECGEAYGELDGDNHTGSFSWGNKGMTTHQKIYNCCGATVEVAHNWKNNICVECGYVNAHIGGKATCTDLAICTRCGEAYGEVDPDNHTDTTYYVQTETAHEQRYICCDAVTIPEEVHEWVDGVCSECTYVCLHMGGEATCNALAVCEVCGESWGELAPENHAGVEAWTTTETNHEKAYVCCGVITVADEAHEWINGVCIECTYICGHTGGEATCKTLAVCEWCDEAYGKVDPNKHEKVTYWTQTETTHEQRWLCCDAVAVASESHEWNDNICSECGYGCNHIGGTATCKALAVCSVCNVAYGQLDPDNHTGKTYWIDTETTHTQKYDCCEATAVEAEAHEWTNGVCLKCIYVCKHNGGTATCTDKAVCEWCGESYGALVADNHTAEATWTKTETTHALNYSCCGAVAIAQENHEWADGVCSECGYTCAHTGGTATCKTLAACSVCGESYGALVADNHEGEAVWTKTATTHAQAYDCCGAVVVEEENHEWSDGVCSECGYTCAHTGGEATCTAQAVCTACGESYGELAAHEEGTAATCQTKAACSVCGESYGELSTTNHTDTTYWIKANTTHEQIYLCCKAVSVAKEAHEWDGGVCTECGFSCDHTGGTATCINKAICSVCSNEYGDLAPENHTGELAWTKTETTHKYAYNCCDVATVEEEAHEWGDNGVCSECRYICDTHTGGDATCKTLGTCSKCGEYYGSFAVDNHEGEAVWTKTETTHKYAYTCCNKVAVAEENHEWSAGTCSECEYVCVHTNGAEVWTTTATTHAKAYNCCGKVVVAEENHEWADGTCSECGYTCTHTGGTATCTTQAVCTVCGESYGSLAEHTEGTAATCMASAICSVCSQSYGDKNADNHVLTIDAAAWATTEAIHNKACTCGTIIFSGFHNWSNGRCTTCDYSSNLITLSNTYFGDGTNTNTNIPVTFNGSNADSYKILLYQGTSYDANNETNNLVMYYTALNASGFALGGGTGVTVFDQTIANSLPAGTYTIRVCNSLNQVVDTREIELLNTGKYTYISAADIYNTWNTTWEYNNPGPAYGYDWGLKVELKTDSDGSQYVTLTTTNTTNVGCGRLFLGKELTTINGYGAISVRYRNNTDTSYYGYGPLYIGAAPSVAGGWNPTAFRTNMYANRSNWETCTAWVDVSSIGIASFDFYTGLGDGKTIDLKYILFCQGDPNSTEGANLLKIYG